MGSDVGGRVEGEINVVLWVEWRSCTWSWEGDTVLGCWDTGKYKRGNFEGFVATEATEDSVEYEESLEGNRYGLGTSSSSYPYLLATRTSKNLIVFCAPKVPT